jgi:hypothetical protein
MKIKLLILTVICSIPLISFTQGINNYKLKIHNNADKLFGQIKNDSNYIEYVKLMGIYAKSLEQKDSTTAISGKVNTSFPPKAIHLLSNLKKTYPLLRQLNNKEKESFARFSVKFFNQLSGYSPDNSYHLFKAFNTLMRLMALSSKG